MKNQKIVRKLILEEIMKSLKEGVASDIVRGSINAAELAITAASREPKLAQAIQNILVEFTSAGEMGAFKITIEDWQQLNKFFDHLGMDTKKVFGLAEDSVSGDIIGASLKRRGTLEEIAKATGVTGDDALELAYSYLQSPRDLAIARKNFLLNPPAQPAPNQPPAQPSAAPATPTAPTAPAAPTTASPPTYQQFETWLEATYAGKKLPKQFIPPIKRIFDSPQILESINRLVEKKIVTPQQLKDWALTKDITNDQMIANYLRAADRKEAFKEVIEEVSRASGIQIPPEFSPYLQEFLRQKYKSNVEKLAKKFAEGIRNQTSALDKFRYFTTPPATWAADSVKNWIARATTSGCVGLIAILLISALQKDSNFRTGEKAFVIFASGGPLAMIAYLGTVLYSHHAEKVGSAPQPISKQEKPNTVVTKDSDGPNPGK